MAVSLSDNAAARVRHYLDKRGGDLVIVRAIIDLARNLGLETVAEGVETEEVLEIVRDLGCDYFQGYLAAQPAAAEDLLPALRDNMSRRLAEQRAA